MAKRLFSIKPRIPQLAGLIIALIYVAEGVCIYAGAPAVTGLNGWICAGLYGLLIILFHFTVWPILVLPLSVMGASAFGVPWLVSVPFFLIPSIYGFFFVRDYRR